MSRGRAIAVLALALVAAVSGWTGLGFARAPRHKTRTVTVNDNWYGPSKLTIHAGDKVRWRWSADTTDVHDVAVRKAPRGAARFHSDPLAAGDTFTRRLTKVGSYRIVCTFHEGMTMTITVRKALR